MKAIHCYLIFDGNCEEAMTFYKDALGGELAITRFGEMPDGPPPQGESRVLHARLTHGQAVLMASDGQVGMPVAKGDNFSISIDCDSAEEQDRCFVALSQGGTIVMPVQSMFWGARFGMFKDKFGIGWMLSFS